MAGQGAALSLLDPRGCSSAGRALRSQRRSRRFESAHLHRNIAWWNGVSALYAGARSSAKSAKCPRDDSYTTFRRSETAWSTATGSEPYTSAVVNARMTQALLDHLQRFARLSCGGPPSGGVGER